MFFEDNKSIKNISKTTKINKTKNNKKIEIGLGLLLLGLSCYFLGIIFVFDRAFFIIGNVNLYQTKITNYKLLL